MTEEEYVNTITLGSVSAMRAILVQIKSENYNVVYEDAYTEINEWLRTWENDLFNLCETDD